MGEMTSPMQGLAYVAQNLAQGLQQRQATNQATEGRQALATAMAQIDPTTGELPPEAKATVAALDPNAYLQLTRDAVTAAREKSQAETKHGWDTEADQARFTHEDTTLKSTQDATAAQNDLNRQADIKRQEMQDANTRGDRAAATQASQELAVLQGKIQAGAAETKSLPTRPRPTRRRSATWLRSASRRRRAVPRARSWACRATIWRDMRRPARCPRRPINGGRYRLRSPEQAGRRYPTQSIGLQIQCQERRYPAGRKGVHSQRCQSDRGSQGQADRNPWRAADLAAGAGVGAQCLRGGQGQGAG